MGDKPAVLPATKVWSEPNTQSAHEAVAELTAPLDAIVGPVIALHHIAQRPLGIVCLRLEVIALSEIREVPAQAGTHHPAPLVVGMAGCGEAVTVTAGESIHVNTIVKVARYERPRIATNDVRATVVIGIDLMGRGHDLGTAPGLVDADIADDVGRLNAAVAGGIGSSHSGGCAADTGNEG